MRPRTRGPRQEELDAASAQRQDCRDPRPGQLERHYEFLAHHFYYSVQDLAAKTGLSKPFLSQIENDHVVPPVATLLKLARALNVGMAHFFQDEMSTEKISVTRSQERSWVERRPHQEKGEVNYRYESLETKKQDKHMEPFLVEFGNSETSEMVFMSHEGEEFLFLLEGKLEFRSVDRVELLDPGDTIICEGPTYVGALQAFSAQCPAAQWPAAQCPARHPTRNRRSTAHSGSTMPANCRSCLSVGRRLNSMSDMPSPIQSSPDKRQPHGAGRPAART